MPVKQRHVFYLSGFDPRGVDAYYRLFKEECPKQAALDSSTVTVSARRNVDALSSTWQTVRTGGGETTTTTFEFLRWDDIVRRHWKTGYLDLLRTALKNYRLWLSGANRDYLLRIRRLSGWTFVLGIAPALTLLLVPLIAVFAGLAGHHLGKLLPVPVPAPWPSLALALLCMWAAFTGALKLEKRINAGWLLRSYGFVCQQYTEGVAEFEQRINAFAARIAAHLQSTRDDETIIVGHSSGANLAVSVLAQTLVAHPSLIKDDQRVCFLTLGGTIPMQGLLAQAEAFRAELALLAGETRLPWVDISSPHDIASFALHNPVTASGVTLNGQAPTRPKVVSGAFGEVLARKTLAKIKYNVFRMHFQYLMAGEKPRANDYFSVTTDHQRFVERFDLK